MEEQWYVYQNSQQSGPFARDKIISLINSNTMSPEAYLFKAGYKDWKPYLECLGDLGLKPAVPAVPKPPKKKRAPRVTLGGRVVVHNNGLLSKGAAVNISASGMFVNTSEEIFRIGEELKVTCSAKDLKPFNATAIVVRYSKEEKGYGLQFKKIDKEIANAIQALIDGQNVKLEDAG